MAICSDCRTCKSIRCRFQTPNPHEKVFCDGCGKVYSWFSWSAGSDKRLCQKCVNNRPSAYLDNIDSIDIEKEHDIIHAEAEEQDRRDFPRDNKQRTPWKPAHMSRKDYGKITKRMDRQVIKRFKRNQKGVVDVTGLG